jgi:hypothetical protein
MTVATVTLADITSVLLLEMQLPPLQLQRLLHLERLHPPPSQEQLLVQDGILQFPPLQLQLLVQTPRVQPPPVQSQLEKGWPNASYL